MIKDPPVQAPPDKKKMLRSFFLGGLLPIIAFTVIEDRYGVLAGTAAGMILGTAEILWEWKTQRSVSPITWGGNGLILVLGVISFYTGEGIWFKLQPSLIESVLALALWGSLILKRPFLVLMVEKQSGGLLHARALQPLRALTFRLGLFLAFHAGLAAWAALYWSTSAWALLKGVGFTVSLVVYLVVESLYLRYRISAK